jgi:hypothetical protein
MFVWARSLFAICGSAAIVACGIAFWWWVGSLIGRMNSFWNSDPAASYEILISLESERFFGFVAGVLLALVIALPLSHIGFRRQRELDAAWKQETRWLREELGLPAETSPEPPSKAPSARISPGRLRFLVIRQAAINGILMLPATLRVLFDETIESHASGFLQQLAWGILIPISFLGGAALAGISSWRTMSRPGVRAEYVASFVGTMEMILVIAAVAFACGTVSAAGFLVAKPALLPSGGLFLVAFILALAILIPIDVSAMIDFKLAAVLCAAVIPWLFAIAFPCYMFARPTTSKRSRWIAVLCMIAGLIGFSVWAGSQARKRGRPPGQSSVALWAQYSLGKPLPSSQERIRSHNGLIMGKGAGSYGDQWTCLLNSPAMAT